MLHACAALARGLLVGTLATLGAAVIAGCAHERAAGPANAATTVGGAPTTGAPTTVAPAHDAERSVFLAFLRTNATDAARQLIATAGDDERFAARLSISLAVEEAVSFGEVSRRAGEAKRVGDRMRLGSPAKLANRDAVEERDRASSFVVDFDEPAVRTVSERARRAYGAHPTSDQLEAFVAQAITDKTVSAFQIASQVAEYKSGDCKSHAVLLAALLRHFGQPARVLTGVVIIGLGDRLLAVGHAWVETHERGRWRIVDAALRPPDDASETSDRAGATTEAGAALPGSPPWKPGTPYRRAYIPLQGLDEGPGFAGTLVQGYGVTHVQAVDIDVDRNAR